MLIPPQSKPAKKLSALGVQIYPDFEHNIRTEDIIFWIAHHFPLLLLLVLQLHGHQSVVELGELSPHHLDLVVHAEAGLEAVPGPEAGVPVHTAAPLYPGPAPAPRPAHPIDQLVPVLRSAGGGVIAHLAQLYGSKTDTGCDWHSYLRLW